MSKIYYEDPETKKLFTSFEDLAKRYDVCQATICKRIKTKKLVLNKVTEKEIVRRAEMFRKKSA